MQIELKPAAFLASIQILGKILDEVNGVCYVRTTALCSLVMQELVAPELDSYILYSYIMLVKDKQFSVRCEFLQSEHMWVSVVAVLTLGPKLCTKKTPSKAEKSFV